MTGKEIAKAKDAVRDLMAAYTKVAKDPVASKQDLKKACDTAIMKMYECLDLQQQYIEDLSVYKEVWRR